MATLKKPKMGKMPKKPHQNAAAEQVLRYAEAVAAKEKKYADKISANEKEQKERDAAWKKVAKVKSKGK